MRVLVACEFSGIVRDAFRAQGHDAWSCDLLPTERDGPHFRSDCLQVAEDAAFGEWDLMIAFPVRISPLAVRDGSKTRKTSKSEPSGFSRASAM